MPVKRGRNRIPYKRRGRKRRTVRLGRPSKGLKMSIHLFKRSFVEYLDLGIHPTTSPWNPTPVTAPLTGVFPQSTTGTSNSAWTISAGFTLKNVPEYSDFQNLFTEYKIQGISEKFMLQQDPPRMASYVVASAMPPNALNGATASTVFPNDQLESVPTYVNSQFLIDSWYNPTEVTTNITQAQLLQIQRRRTKTLRTLGPKFYSRLKQHKELYNPNAVITSITNAVARGNAWIPLETNALDIPHYGLTHFIRTSTHSGTMSHVTVRMERTLYIACRGVR